MSAHALLQTSQPANGSTVDTPPPVVLMTFGERPDVGLSSATIVDTSGAPWSAGRVEAVAGNADELALPLEKLPRGVYTVTWRTVSAVDGHLASGSFSFGVQVSAASVTATAPAASPASPSPGLPAVAGRVLLYLGLIAMLGAAGVALWVAGPLSSVLRLVAAAWALSAAGMVVTVAGGLRDAGVGVDDALSSSLGTTIVERFIAALVGGVAVWLLIAVPRVRTWSLGVAAASALGAMLVDVLASHAAAEGTPAFEVVMQLVHIAAVGVWIGGLVALLVALRSLPDGSRGGVAGRFSLVATASIGAVAATGSVRALASLNAWSQLWDTGYGRLVVAKIGLILALASLGAVNHWRNVPRARFTALRRVGGGELVVAITAVAVAGALVNLAPPSQSASAAPAPTVQPLVVTASDFATTARLRLEVSPGTPGFDRFTLAVSDYDSGAPVDATSVSLRFSLPGGGVGDSTLTLPRVSPGTYSATGGNLAVAGTWRIEALVQESSTSIDVPMQLTTRPAQENVSCSRAAGQPTIVTVDVGQQRSVQLYLDSEKPGPSHLHATFFDAGGNELAVPEVTITSSLGGASPQTLAIQRIDPGHVSGALSLALGSYKFQVTATTSSGETLSATLDLSITSTGASPSQCAR